MIKKRKFEETLLKQQYIIYCQTMIQDENENKEI